MTHHDDGLILTGTVIAAMLIVAWSDRRITFDEQATVLEFMDIARGDRFRVDQHLELIQRLADFVCSLPEEEWHTLFAQSGALSVENKQWVLDLSVRMSFADGQCSERDRDLLEAIARWIDMPHDALIAWRARVNAATDGVRAQGIDIPRF